MSVSESAWAGCTLMIPFYCACDLVHSVAVGRSSHVP